MYIHSDGPSEHGLPDDEPYPSRLLIALLNGVNHTLRFHDLVEIVHTLDSRPSF